jgi:hypothetical protein
MKSTGEVRAAGSRLDDREQTLTLLRSKNPELAASCNVSRIAMFGSFMRGEAGADSDLDAIVEFSKPTSLLGLVRLQDLLAERLRRRVDLFTPASLHPAPRSRILEEAVDA